MQPSNIGKSEWKTLTARTWSENRILWQDASQARRQRASTTSGPLTSIARSSLNTFFTLHGSLPLPATSNFSHFFASKVFALLTCIKLLTNIRQFLRFCSFYTRLEVLVPSHVSALFNLLRSCITIELGKRTVISRTFAQTTLKSCLSSHNCTCMCMCVCVDGYVNDKVSYVCLHIWFGWEVLAQSWKKFKTSFRSVWVTKLQIIEKSLKVFFNSAR